MAVIKVRGDQLDIEDVSSELVNDPNAKAILEAGLAVGGLSDVDEDTQILVEASADEDIIRMDTGDNVVGFPAKTNTLILSSAEFTLALPTADVATTVGGAIALTAGQGNTTGNGGALTLTSGDGGSSNGYGGAINITSGAGSGGGNNRGGDITLAGGDGSYIGGSIKLDGGNANGYPGGVYMTGGTGSVAGGGFSFTGGQGTNYGGQIILRCGDSQIVPGKILLDAGNGNGGNTVGGPIDIESGSGFGSGNGGDVTLAPGFGGTSGDGGAINLTAGVSGSATGNGGAIVAKGGRVQLVGVGGAVSLTGGDGGVTSGNGGAVSLTGGIAFDGDGGGINITAGDSGSGATGAGGALNITAGDAVSTNDDGGDITLTPGAGNGSGFDGAVILSQTTAPTITTNKLYNVGGELTWNANILLDAADIGVAVQAFDATILVDADIGSTVQAFDDNLLDLAALGTVADNEVMVGTGAGVFAFESGATLQTSLGLAIGTDVLAEQAIGIADNNLLEVDAAAGVPADDEYARFTANGLEGRTESEFKGDFNLEIGTDVAAFGAAGVTPTATTGELTDISNAINTDALKVAGFMVFNTTTEAPVWAVGDGDGSLWNDATGATAHTPA